MSSAPWVVVEPGTIVEGAVIELDRAEAHHLVNVRRHDAGPVVVTDGKGLIAEGVAERARRAVRIRLGPVTRAPAPVPKMTLAVAVVKGQAMDRAVQQAVEMGVERLIPILAERSQLSRTHVERRLGRWHELGRQALKQCRRGWELEFGAAQTIEQLVHGVLPSRGIVADASGTAVCELSVPACPVVLIGPEGGLTDVELKCVRTAGWSTVSLGQYVLRTPTAAVVATALVMQRIQHEQERRGSFDCGNPSD